MGVEVCIHGHFYQPPRENPWLDRIEPQPSAAPWPHWNARIADECYAPNAAAQPDGELGQEGSNNYAGISFNFGPTLLDWLAKERPAVLNALQEADRTGADRFDGHGPAIAQAYNHMIMPLASERDRRTQVRWGVADFRHRFGRRPEGMWLPETAVDLPTLEALASADIRFTLLAPHQGEAISQQGDVGPVTTTAPYRVELPSGRSIAVFFYDSEISGAVAFGGLLTDADRFTRRLLEPPPVAEGPRPPGDRRPTDEPLHHIATDGETYGHHFKGGEQALAATLRAIGEGRDGRLTVYGAHLERHPPDRSARIVERTSWSCDHGVQRWCADCGCAGGREEGYSQAWRAPLRDALDALRDATAERYDEIGGQLLTDPWAARDDYIRLVLSPGVDALRAFLDDYARFPGRDRGMPEVERALGMLEQQRYAMLMYTSCGWFFDDPADIETIQILQYAGRSVQLADAWLGIRTEERFLSRLQEMVSNDRGEGDGRTLWQRHVRPHMVRHPVVATGG